MFSKLLHNEQKTEKVIQFLRGKQSENVHNRMTSGPQSYESRQLDMQNKPIFN